MNLSIMCGLETFALSHQLDSSSEGQWSSCVTLHTLQALLRHAWQRHPLPWMPDAGNTEDQLQICSTNARHQKLKSVLEVAHMKRVGWLYDLGLDCCHLIKMDDMVQNYGHTIPVSPTSLVATQAALCDAAIRLSNPPILSRSTEPSAGPSSWQVTRSWSSLRAARGCSKDHPTLCKFKGGSVLPFLNLLLRVDTLLLPVGSLTHLKKVLVIATVFAAPVSADVHKADFMTYHLHVFIPYG